MRKLIALGLMLALAVSAAHAQSYPERPVEMAIGYGAGSSVDIVSRALAEEFRRSLGRPFLMANKPGASGSIAVASVASSKPDGYVLGVGPIAPITNVLHTIERLPFSVNSFDYICQFFLNDFSIVVADSSPYRTVQDLLAAIKAKPGALSYGHSGNVTTPHLAIAELLHVLGLEALAVPFPRGTGPTELLTKQVDFSIIGAATIAGREDVRMLALFGDVRHPGFPTVPTLSELGYKVQPHKGINGLFAPKGTPPEVLSALENACRRATASESFIESARKQNATVRFIGHPGFRQADRERSSLQGRARPHAAATALQLRKPSARKPPKQNIA